MSSRQMLFYAHLLIRKTHASFTPMTIYLRKGVWNVKHVCSARPTNLYVLMHWMMCQVQASRQMELPAFYIAFMFDSMATFCGPRSSKTYQWSGTIRWSRDLRLIRADSAFVYQMTYHSPLTASWGWRLDVMSSSICYLVRYIYFPPPNLSVHVYNLSH